MTDLFSRPGSMTVYTTSPRYGLPAPSNVPNTVGPASYDTNKNGIVHREETVAPFDNTAIRFLTKEDISPGPNEYNPWKRSRRQVGTPLLGSTGTRFSCDDYSTPGPGPVYKILDPWVYSYWKIYHLTNTMRPRVGFEKFVSNNAPSIFHPHDIRCFILGADSRMYPWRFPEWKAKIPGPKYNPASILTSKNKTTRKIDFGRAAGRKELFPPVLGFSPADFDTRLSLNGHGGIFLGLTEDYDRSTPRMFDSIMRRQLYLNECGPADYMIPNCFDKPCPKAVMAPFKSKTPKCKGLYKIAVGPGPQDHFQCHLSIDDLKPPVFGYSKTRPPKSPSFFVTEEKFFSPNNLESRPDPCAYYILGFTDWLRYDLIRHPPAVINPQLGFLTSASARPLKPDIAEEAFCRVEYLENPPEEPRKWKNMRPKKIRTYPYHQPPPKGPETPAPNAYDTRRAIKYIKGKHESFNPRDWTGTGFGNSGCGRKIEFNQSKGIPGPKYLLPSFLSASGGNIKSSEERFKPVPSVGPGPRHKLHDKTGGIWRATHLGTFNVFLKGIGGLSPNSGGYRPRGPIDNLGDLVQGITREDDYKGQINSLTTMDNFGQPDGIDMPMESICTEKLL